MYQIVYLLVFLLLSPLLFSFWAEGITLLASGFDFSALTWFGSGLLACVVAGGLLGGTVIEFLTVAVHELVHAFAGFLFVGQVKYIEAKSKGGGHTDVEAGWGCNPFLPFFFLAPYFLPLLALPFLIAKPLVAGLGALVNHGVDLLIGFALGFHYVMHVKQFRFGQTDLQKVGPLVSVGLTYTLMLIFLVIAVEVVLGKYSSILDFFNQSFTRAPEYYQVVLAWLRGVWEQLGPQVGL